MRARTVGGVPFSVLCLLCTACGGSRAPVEEPGGAHAAEPAPPPVAGARTELVAESVFGGRVLVTESGVPDAEAIVLVHGLGQNASRDFHPVLPELAARHRVIAIDLPGFGGSTGGNHAYSPDAYARVLHEVLRVRVPSPFVLVGHSMGGAISLLYAARHPDRVSKLVVVDAAGILHRDTYTSFMIHARLQSTLASAATTLMSPFARRTPAPELLLESALTRETFLGGDPNRIAALALILHDFGPALDGVRAPTLILWGADDDIAAIRVAHLLETRLPAARLEVREGVGHVPMAEDPAWVSAQILAFASAPVPVQEPPAAAAEDVQDSPQASAERPGGVRAAGAGGPRIATDRVGRCVDQREPRRFEGAYDRIELERCRDVTLHRVVARQVVAEDTVLTLDRVRIVGSTGGPGLDLTESVARMTGGHIEAPVCVRLSGSELDVAGAVLRCEESSFVATDRSK